jgi:uncharacterized protein (DUF1330 family)
MYSRYIDAARPVVESFGGRYLVRGGQVLTLAGGWHPERIVVIEFSSMDKMRACFASPDYLRLAPLRERSTTSKAIAVEGCDKSVSPQA